MPTLVIGTAGHIDHGKSALVRALTGIDPDRLKEEQARGITIDLGFAHATVGDVDVAFVDVPGHERFVRNMLAGAGGIDAVLLVIAANESVKPQTREHFDICRLLGVRAGLIVLTKSDLVDDGGLALASAEAADLVAGSFLEGAPIVPVSATTGRGLDALRGAMAALAGQPPRQHRAGVVRLPIDRAFAVKGFGAVVTGTLVSGRLAAGDELAVLPGGARVRIRGLQVHGKAAGHASAPQRVAVNLAGVDAAALHRGLTIATPGTLAVTTRVDVHLRLLAAAPPLAHGARVRMHQGTTEILARVSLAAVRGADGGWRAAQPGDAQVVVPPGGEAFARLRLPRPAVLTRGDQLVLRAASPVETIGGARVLDPEPPAGGVRRQAALARFERLHTGDAAAVAELFLAEAGGRGIDEATLVRRGGFDGAQARQDLELKRDSGRAVAAGPRMFSALVAGRLAERLEAEVARFHAGQPGEAGMPRETLRTQVAPRVAPELFDAVLAGLAAAGRLRVAERVALASHQPGGAVGDRDVRARVEARLLAAGLAPPDAGALAGELGLADAETQRVVRALVQEGRLVRIGDLAYHRDPLAALKGEIAALRRAQPPGAKVTLDVGTFKARYGLSRKFAIPLLEYLDRERVTRRQGDGRIVL